MLSDTSLLVCLEFKRLEPLNFVWVRTRKKYRHADMEKVSAGRGSCMCSLNGSRSRPQPHVPQNPVCRCLEAAEAGDLQFLQSKAQQLNGCLREEVSYCAAEAGHLEVLQWLRPQHMAPGRGTCTGAAAGGHLVVLQWAREQGCYWDEYTCAVAAGNGHLAVLQYAHQNGCAWSSWTCEAAARGGHLAVLQFAHQNGCQWSSRTCSAAAESGNLSILKLAAPTWLPMG